MHIWINAKTKHASENKQCWKFSRNADYKHPMIQGKTCRQLRAQDSGSHGSKGPSAGQYRLSQKCHMGPLTSPSVEAKVNWGPGPVGRVGVSSMDLHLWCGTSLLVHKVGSRWMMCNTWDREPHGSLLQIEVCVGGGVLKWRHTTSCSSTISLFLSP